MAFSNRNRQDKWNQIMEESGRPFGPFHVNFPKPLQTKRSKLIIALKWNDRIFITFRSGNQGRDHRCLLYHGIANTVEFDYFRNGISIVDWIKAIKIGQHQCDAVKGVPKRWIAYWAGLIRLLTTVRVGMLKLNQIVIQKSNPTACKVGFSLYCFRFLWEVTFEAHVP